MAIRVIRNFWSDEQGHDLMEYTFLLAFVILASASLFHGAGKSVSGIWSVGSSRLATASAAASPDRAVPHMSAVMGNSMMEEGTRDEKIPIGKLEGSVVTTNSRRRADL